MIRSERETEDPQRGLAALTDFHTHILPGIDDGSRDLQMTEEMLREEKRQGVRTVIATPHFYAGRMSMDRFLERRAEALERTEQRRQASDEPLPEILAGAEVYYFQGMGAAEGIERLCIGETRTILVELPFGQWNREILKDVEELIYRQGLRVVLAHVERYIFLQRDRTVWDRIMALPLTPQINAESFLRKRGLFHPDRERKFCMKFLAEHPGTVIGSDCHNMKDRPPNLKRAEEEIGPVLGRETLRRTQDEAGRLLTV